MKVRETERCVRLGVNCRFAAQIRSALRWYIHIHRIGKDCSKMFRGEIFRASDRGRRPFLVWKIGMINMQGNRWQRGIFGPFLLCSFHAGDSLEESTELEINDNYYDFSVC